MLDKMETQNQMNGALERKILLIVTRNAIVIVLLYIFLYVFMFQSVEKSGYGVLALLLYIGVYWLIRVNFSNTVKRIAAVWFMFSITMGFFAHNGFFGATSLDICCLIIVLPLIFHGSERLFFISAFILLIVFFGFIQIFYPSLTWNYQTGMGEPGIVNVFEVLMRCANMMYVGYVYKYEYEKEKARIVRINKQLENANVHIAKYTMELEEIVNQRTQTIQQLNERLFEYAFFNSHKVRGPLARILGLVYLIKMHSSRNQQATLIEDEEYVDKLYKSADELDTVIKEINLILEKGTKCARAVQLQNRVA